MIAKGNTHMNGLKLAAYMTAGKEGERAEMWQLRGFEATNIRDAFHTVQIMSGATKCEQPFFHLQVRNRDGERLSRHQWEETADRIERMLGLTGQPRAIAFHTFARNGEEHMHVAWSRIDEETLLARPLPYFKERLKKISRELELHFALEPVTNTREGNIKYGPTRGEFEQARRLGLNVHELRNAIRNCYDRSDCGSSFQAALEHEGFVLARGEERDFIVIDRAGGMHALGKRILDVSAAKIREKLSDVAREDLPTVAVARALVHELGKEKEREKTGEAWDRDRADRDWQNAVANAAIDKEKAERKFIDPRERETPTGRQEKEQGTGAGRGLDASAAVIRLSYSLSRTPEEFARNLDECGFRLATATREEAAESHRAAAFAKAARRYAPEYRENEFVAVNERGQVYSLNQRTTGNSAARVREFMAPLDRAEFGSIRDTLERVQQRGGSLEIERALTAGGLKQEKDLRPAGREARESRIDAPLKKVRPIAGAGEAAIKIVGKVFEVAANAFESLLAPVASPEQKLEGRKAKEKREAEAEYAIDFSRFTAELARQEEREQQAARDRERGGRER